MRELPGACSCGLWQAPFERLFLQDGTPPSCTRGLASIAIWATHDDDDDNCNPTATDSLCIRGFDPKRCPMCRAPFSSTIRLRVEASNQQTPAARPRGSTSHSVPRWQNAHCTMCSSPIFGDRYKCSDCPDYNTCAACFDLVLEHHPYHSFFKIRDPSDLIAPHAQLRAERHNVACANCNWLIHGVRYQCADCQNYDLCAGCEALPIAVHIPGHVMFKMRTPDTFASARRSGVTLSIDVGNALTGQSKVQHTRKLLRKARK
ncbi:hypothetical protein FIBSPDRAFT_927631 [Athelia psychrophila]|uniref:ZZ-type domain-containing protein n=1 Tax=Athelia psychrophila TaxID=1759441 RepID=A0A166RQ54_9AGAM|nr:hypothetical protein FIBSPDRAFT_927631 [Fibularhizoctonia sp. CBS 109695]